MSEGSSEDARELQTFALLDGATDVEARALMSRCCGSRRWVAGMLERRPFGSDAALGEAAREVWRGLGRDDYLEAFAEHPAIGADLAAQRARFAATSAWSSAEQAGVDAADQATLRALAAGNRAYRERFGYTFIVCATGKSAREMLDALSLRLANDAAHELSVAAGEQMNITLLRLAKLAAAASPR